MQLRDENIEKNANGLQRHSHRALSNDNEADDEHSRDKADKVTKRTNDNTVDDVRCAFNGDEDDSDFVDNNKGNVWMNDADDDDDDDVRTVDGS